MPAQGMTAEKWKATPTKHFGDRAAEFLKLYPGDTDEQAVRSAIDYGSDTFIAFGTWKWIEAHVKTGERRSIAITSNWPRRPASIIPARLPFTPTTSSMSLERWTRGPARSGGRRIAS